MLQPVRSELTYSMDSPESGVRAVLPRLQSTPDSEYSVTTLMTEAVAELARLSDLSSAPKLTRPIGRDIDMTPKEAYVASLLGAGTDLATILDLSPLSDDATFGFLARLVMLGIVIMPQHARR